MNKLNEFTNWLCGVKGTKFPFFQDMPEVEMPINYEEEGMCIECHKVPINNARNEKCEECKMQKLEEEKDKMVENETDRIIEEDIEDNYQEKHEYDKDN